MCAPFVIGAVSVFAVATAVLVSMVVSGACVWAAVVVGAVAAFAVANGLIVSMAVRVVSV